MFGFLSVILAVTLLLACLQKSLQDLRGERNALRAAKARGAVVDAMLERVNDEIRDSEGRLAAAGQSTLARLSLPATRSAPILVGS